MTSELKTHAIQYQDIIQMGDHVYPTGHHGYHKGNQRTVILLRGSLSYHYVASLDEGIRICFTPRREGRH